MKLKMLVSDVSSPELFQDSCLSWQQLETAAGNSWSAQRNGNMNISSSLTAGRAATAEEAHVIRSKAPEQLQHGAAGEAVWLLDPEQTISWRHTTSGFIWIKTIKIKTVCINESRDQQATRCCRLFGCWSLNAACTSVSFNI